MKTLGVLACLLSLSIVVSGLPFVWHASAAVGNESIVDLGLNNDIVSNVRSIGLSQLSNDQIEEMMSVIGVRDPNIDYNIIIDGFGTGLAPPSAAEWEQLRVSGLSASYQGSEDLMATATFDLSTSAYFPKVGNQGTQGSCAAWAVAYYAYGYMEAADNGWSGASTGVTSNLISPAFTYNRLNDYDHGSTITANGYVLRDWGAATMAAMPYVQADYTSWGTEAAMREAPLHKALSVVMVTDKSVTSVKAAVQAGKPVSFGIDAGQFGSSFLDGNKIISSTEYNGSKSLNHAQTIVGWDDTITDDGDVGAFKVVNSWGTGFGISGYYYITYAAFAEMAAKATPSYLEDKVDFVPTMGTVMQFGPGPGMDTTMTVSVVNTTTGVAAKTKTVYFRTFYYYGAAPLVPSYVYFDLSELRSYYNATNCRFTLAFSGGVTGTLTNFQIENYDGGYVANHPSSVSASAIGLPVTTTGSVSLDFPATSGTDTTAPISAATLSGTVGSAQWYTSTVQVSVSASDVGSGVSRTYYRLDGASWQTYSSAVSVTSDGSHVFDYYSVDISGSSETAKSVSFKKDSTLPSSSASASGTVVTVNAADGTSGVSAKHYRVNGGSWNVYSSSFDVTSYGAPCTVEHYAIDVAGNNGAVGSLIVGQADVTAPVSSISASGTVGSNGWYISQVTVSLTATDDDSGVATSYLRIDGGSWTTYAAPLTISTDGTHTVDYYSVDVKGNVETSRSMTVKEDKVAPSSSSSVSASTVTLTASDAVSGVSVIYYRIDGGSWKTYTGVFNAGATGIEHLVEFYAKDMASNAEVVRLVTVFEESVPVTPVPPSAPTGLKARAVTNGVKLTWSAPTSTGSQPLLGYKVYREVGSGGMVYIGSTTSLSYIDYDEVGGVYNYYYVSAYSSAGESSLAGPAVIKPKVSRTLSSYNLAYLEEVPLQEQIAPQSSDLSVVSTMHVEKSDAVGTLMSAWFGAIVAMVGGAFLVGGVGVRRKK